MHKVRAATLEEMDAVRALFREYAASLNVDLCFQDFNRELAELPGTYSPILVSTCETAPTGLTGCVALRPLTPAIGEMKRLYIRPPYRGQGLGRRLAESIIQAARDRHYQSLRLDTLPHLREAITLYRRLGFQEIAPYSNNPVPGALFLELQLH